MNREHIQLLMNRAVDGAASADEREQLARVLKVDALLRSEFEELQTVHSCTESMFRQISLRDDFAQRVMRRIQTGEVPADANIENVRVPAHRPVKGLPARNISQRRVRLYAAIAGVSAAAAALLAAGVFTGFFARAGIGTESVNPGLNPKEENSAFAADGRRGVPDREELNRTDSSTHQPSISPEKSAPVRTPEPTPPSKTGVEPAPEGTPKKVNIGPISPEPKEPVVPQPEKVEPEPLPEVPDDLVDSGDPGKEDPVPGPIEQPESPKDTVDNGNKTDEGKTVVTPEPRVVLGKLQVLSGRAELVKSDGSTSRLKDQDQEIHVGDRIRTKYDAVVVIALGGGLVTLGKDTQVMLDSEQKITLELCGGKEKGQVALDRSISDCGDSLLVRVSDYDMYLMNGAVVIERKRQGINVTKAVGFATVTHNDFGSVVLGEESGYTAEIQFGKEYDAPLPVTVQLPQFAGEARGQDVMLSLDTVLAERTFIRPGERTHVNRNLPGRLERLMAYPMTCDSVVEFMTTAIRNETMTGADILNVVSEVQIAYGTVTELSPAVINGHAARAALAGESFDQWRDYFYRLMRPPVEPKKPASTSSSSTECPTDKDKLKRVDEPPVKRVKNPPQNPSGQPTEDEKKED